MAVGVTVGNMGQEVRMQYAVAARADDGIIEVILAESRDDAEGYADRHFSLSLDYPDLAILVENNQGGYSVVRGEGKNLSQLADYAADERWGVRR